MAFVIPLYFHSFWVVLGFYAFVTFLIGITLTVVFVLAHCVSEAEFVSPGNVQSEWSIHQIETTVDFARSNRLLNWYLGGLNFQVEHHLFPNICHVHYRDLSKIIEKTCDEYGVQYKSHDTMWSALGSHYRWLKEMGRAPEAVGL
jgi:linoleoyl-CoA desaturase